MRQLRQFFRAVGNTAVFLGTLTVISSAVIAGPERMLDRASADVGPTSLNAATADCTKATATSLVDQHQLNTFELPDPVQQVLCGSFTGAGSEAMVVAIGAPTCWGTQRWAVFRFVGGWQLVLDQPEWIFLPIVAVGNDLQVTSPVFRPGDARCLPSGGKHARVWHWDGSKVVAGPYKQVSPGDVSNRWFYSPTRNIFCAMGDSNQFRGANCTIFEPARKTAELNAAGQVKVVSCHGSSCKDCGCREEAPILPYEHQLTVGRFECVSLKSGMKCTVSKTGKGFLINRSGIKRRS